MCKEQAGSGSFDRARGRSRWRGFYGQVGDAFVIAAIGPEAKVDPRKFTRAVQAATTRLSEVEV